MIVEWVDSGEATGWSHVSSLDLGEIIVVLTAGWCVRETDDYLGIAASVASFNDRDADNFQVNSVMQIPKRAIVREYQAQDVAEALANPHWIPPGAKARLQRPDDATLPT